MDGGFYFLHNTITWIRGVIFWSRWLHIVTASVDASRKLHYQLVAWQGNSTIFNVLSSLMDSLFSKSQLLFRKENKQKKSRVTVLYPTEIICDKTAYERAEVLASWAILLGEAQELQQQQPLPVRVHWTLRSTSFICVLSKGAAD